jgi:hypothetical protein
MSKIISIVTIQKPSDTSSIEVKTPFACLLYSNQEKVSSNEMESIANWLVNSGCRYAVCAGLKCSEWHDTIDTADTIRDPHIQNLIMTTWHKNETVEDVVWFWLNLTDFEDIAFENYLALLISDSKAIEEKIQQAIQNNSL